MALHTTSSRCTLFLSFGLLICLGTRAQKQGPALADSLKQALPAMSVDSIKLKALISICASYENTNPDSAWRYGQEAIVLAKKEGNTKDLGLLYGGMGKMAMIKGDNKTAQTLFDEDYEIAKKANDKKSIENIMYCMSGVDQQTSNYAAAVDHTLRAVGIAEEMKDTSGMEIGYINTSVLFYAEENFPKTIEYAEKALTTGRHQPNTLNHVLVLSKAYETLGATYYRKKDTAAARKNYEAALKIYQDNRMPMGVATMYTQLANTTDRNYVAMLQYALKAQAIWDTLAPRSRYSIVNLGNIGIAYGDLARDSTASTGQIPGIDLHPGREALLKKAALFLGKAVTLTKEEKNYDNQTIFMDSLAGIQALLGQYKDAYWNLKGRNILYDSLFSQENKNTIASMDEKYQVALRDGQIAVKNEALAAQARQRWFMIGGMALLVIIGLLLYRQNRVRRKTNTTLMVMNNQLDAANDVKLKFMGILNHDLRGPVANLINFLHLQKEAPDLMDAASAREHSQKIQTHAENLLVTMEDLLSWSKGQMKNFTPQLKDISVEVLFADMEKHFAGTPGVTFTFEASPHFQLHTDEHYLKTIMRNLTGNAIKALIDTPNAEILWKAWEKDGKVYLSITDNGPGATDQQLQTLYDGSLPVGIKSGLGLHLVRDLAKAISCIVSVRSTPGKGTEFQLSL